MKNRVRPGFIRPARRALARPVAVAAAAILASLALPASPALPVAATATAATGGAPDARSDSTARRYRAVRIEPGAAPAVDGRIGAGEWPDSLFTAGFRQREPDEGEPPSTPVRVAIVHDEDHLYVAARMERSDPSSIRRQTTRRDEAGTSATFQLHLDPERDRRTAKVFGVTAAGARVDYRLSGDRKGHRDPTYDPVWEAEATVDSAGWTAEARIPFGELRLSNSSAGAWGLQMLRTIPTRNEVDHWDLVSRTREGWASRFGLLTGLSGIDRSRPVEARPYVATRGGLRPDGGAANPLRSNPSTGVRVGGELSAGLGSGLTLDATVNPDFGQVEADPARVNLSAYEVFFRENRPFFTEGRSYLTGDGPDYFYSRRIGAPPHGRASGRHVRAPDNTTILGAAKLTGAVAGDLSVGALGAVTAEERARVVDSAGGEVRSVRVEPRTAWGVGRIEEQLGGGGTLGLSMTGVRRDLPSGSPLAERLPRTSVAGGGDWNVRFGDGSYVLSGHAGMSRVSGSRDAILDLQRSSVRYFQRPGADHVRVDSSRTSLLGWNAGLELGRRSGEHWLWNVEASASSPEFAVNDAGRLRMTDDLEASGELTYRETDPGDLFRRWRLSLQTFNAWNFGGTRRFTGISPEASVTWPNFMRSSLRVFGRIGGMDDRATRGGPLLAATDTWGAFLRHSTNPRDPNQYSLGVGLGTDELGGWDASLRGSASVRPSPDLRLEFAPRLSMGEEPRQYVRTLGDGPEATYGDRYVFARIDRTTLSAEVRASYAFDPGLSVELFAQPFAARGDYHSFGELRRPGDLGLLRYGEEGSEIVERDERSLTVEARGERFRVPEPDFNVYSFRSTAVLRWQWRPGSTLHLAWQQNRRRRLGRGREIGVGGWLEPFGAAGEQAVTAKMTYWLQL